MIVRAQREEDRRDLLPWASCTSHSGANLSSRETAGPQLWSQRQQYELQSRQARYGYHLPVLSVQHFPTSPMCHSARCLWESTCLVPCTYSRPLMCQRLRSLLKHGQTNFPGKFLSLEIGQNEGVTSKISISAVTVVLLRKLVLSLPRLGHLVPVPTWCQSLGQLRHPQSSSLSISTPPCWGREWAATFQKLSFTQKTRISLNVLSKQVIKQEIIIINPRLFWSDGQIWS